MQFGITLPNLSGGDVHTTVDRIYALAERADALGFDIVWAVDHLVMPDRIQSRYPYNASNVFAHAPGEHFFDALTVLSAVAARTKRIRIGTSVLVLPLRHPVLTAKMLATLDCMSGGRVTLGAGIGWMREEFSLLGAASFDQRAALSEEYVAILRELWTNPHPSHRGEFYQFEGFTAEPRPLQQPIPIWIGGNSDAALRRAARLGDGWHGISQTPAQFSEIASRLASYRAQAGRTGPFTTSLLQPVLLDPTAGGSSPEATWQTTPFGASAMTGTPAQIATSLRRFRHAGLGAFSLYPALAGQPPTTDNTLRAMDIFAQQVIPALA
ncbi:MAG: LLM class F420-dependent oxidoreductase [Dehalococcoidia bacterium]|nr:LLM class F420-dependent oxidoreductase [Dehalococcoidia bacterium]